MGSATGNLMLVTMHVIYLFFAFQDAKSKDIEDVLILSGDHLYRMDYMDFVQVIYRIKTVFHTCMFKYMG